MMQALDIHNILKSASSRVVGVSIGTWGDKSTWRVDWDGNESQSDLDAVAAAIASFVWNELDYIKKDLRAKVDADAETCRLQYITPGAGMAMTYQEKFSQAQAVDALGQATANAMTPEERAAQYPTLSASVGLEAATLWDCAQLVITRYEAFAALSAVIEAARLGGKLAISNASDAAAAQAAYEAITWPSP